jgi:hypothetical protein
MSSPSDQDHAAATIAALSSVYGVALQLTGAIAGISAVAYFIGFRENQAYFRELGCTWYISLLAASDVIQTAIPALWGLALTGFIQFDLFLRGKASAKYFAKTAFVCSVLGTGLSILPDLLSHYLQPLAIHVIAVVANSFILWAAGTFVAEFLARFVESGRSWRAEHLTLVYLIVMFAAWYAPDQSGRARADADSDPTYTKLPEVKLTEVKTGERWYLVHVIENRFLVGTFGAKPADRHFRVVEAKDIRDVRSD